MSSPVDHWQPSPEEEGNGRRSRPTAAEYDLVVIGEGLPAVAAAREGAARGSRVALVTSGDGRPPSRVAPWGVAHVLREAARAAYQGTTTTGVCPPPEFQALLHQARQLGARLATLRSFDRLAETGIDLYPGPAVFTRLEALEADGRELVFRRAVLVLASRPGPLGIAGAAEAGTLTEESLLELEQLPERLIVLGLGPWECQWAQTFQRLGSQVHLVGAAPRVLPEEPAEAAAIVQRQLEQEGVQLLVACPSWTIERTGTQRAVVIEHGRTKEKLFADHILLDQPRQADFAALRLEAAGVMVTERGIVTDPWLRTTNRRILATGDVCGYGCAWPELAETLARRCVANALTRWPRRLDCLAVPHCVWTDPEVVRVGRTEAELAAEAVILDTYRAELAETDQAVLEQRETGYAVVRVRRATGQIASACLVAEKASELVAPLLLLNAYDLTLSDLADMVACHPSRFELIQRVADRYRHGPPPSLRLFLQEAWHRWWRRWSRPY